MLAGLEEALRHLGGEPPGLDRHAALVAVLIEAGALAQGLADAEFSARGEDAASPAIDAATALLTSLARAVLRSWNSAFAGTGPLPLAEIASVAALDLPERLLSKRAEGFAYYALYPEAYACAAATLPPGSPTRVIGLRSIGTTLGAMVAAALGAPPPITLRPVGHPFRRELAVAETLAAALLEGHPRFAVVDEGPGLSGSSFGAVMDFLTAGGVPESRIHLLPGHAGQPGAQASEADRARWARVARHPALFEDLLLNTPRPEHRLSQWASDRLGPADAPLQDLSGGAWRQLQALPAWPPVHPYMERRKFLHRTGGASWLLKFAGLGHHGAETAERARRLAEAGLTPPVAGLLHGFLAEHWVSEARPLDPAAHDREALVGHLGRYLAFRARHLPAAPGEGASAETLWHMARHNTAEALGEAAAARLDRWKPVLPQLEGRMRRVHTDNRLHAWEWLVLPDGRLLKTDAVDHATAHDLVGCQDIAWDVAGAAIELGLSAPERDRLAASLDSGVDPALLAFLTLCYLAFQLGYYAMAADAWGGGQEADRARAASARYARELGRSLSA